MTRPLALTDIQLAQLRQAARLIPHDWRDGFLQEIVVRLDSIHSPTDDDLRRSIVATLAGLGVGTKTSTFLCDSTTNKEKVR